MKYCGCLRNDKGDFGLRLKEIWDEVVEVLMAMGTDLSGPGAIRVLREFALAISWIIVNVCPDTPVALQELFVNMNDPIHNYPVNNSEIDITAMELVKLISVPKLSDTFKPCLYPILIYNTHKSLQ